MFSSRLPDHLGPNAFSRTLTSLRGSQTPLLDLTETNPTVVGLPYPEDSLLALAAPEGLRYQPDPRGMPGAREAIAAEYARAGVPVSPDRLVLTSGTSEAYSLIFKLLCSPGDEVLVPEPSYPLFDLLTRLDGVVAPAYRLEYQGVWWIDRQSVETALSPRTRAVLIVSPNNPTGSMLRSADRAWLLDLCSSRGLALVADEVFADYPLSPRPDASRAAGDDDRVLTFTLGGLSKSAGLPQMKLAWMSVSGPSDRVDDALARLDLIADAYLTVGTPVQLAASALLEAGRDIRAAITERIRRNLAALRAQAAAYPATRVLEPEGGWSVVVQVPATHSEEEIVLTLLQHGHVVVHPGYFFDFSREALLVLSLLPAPDVFDAGIARVLAMAGGEVRAWRDTPA